MPFESRGGTHVAGTHLWCDTPRARGVCVLTSADAAGSGASVIATAITSRLLAALGRSAEALDAPYGRPFSIGAARIELFPSGLLPGAASALFEIGGERLVFAGAIGRQGAEERLCDAMCLYAPIGAIDAHTRPAGDVALAAARAAAARDGTPVLLAPGLAEALAAVRDLAAVGVAVRAPRRLRTALAILGAATLPFRGTPPAGAAVLWPLGAKRAAAVTRLAQARPVVLPTIACAGDALVAFVAASQAQRVVVVGPGAEDLAVRLRARGLEARPLVAHARQLALFDAQPSSPRPVLG
ncbi:MAG: hypothetical protein AABZ30_09010 [Myxococcota bacterium]